MNKPTFNDVPRWWCGSCAQITKDEHGNYGMNMPPSYCLCLQQELKKRLDKEQTIEYSHSIVV